MKLKDFAQLLHTKRVHAILTQLRALGVASATEVGEATGLSGSYLSESLAELRRSGLLLCEERYSKVVPGRPGRHMKYYSLHPELKQWWTMTEGVLCSLQRAASDDAQEEEKN